MFSRVVGAGAQALVLQLADPSAVLNLPTASTLPQVHLQQLKNRGCVVKVMRTEPWASWLDANYPTTLPTSALNEMPQHLTKVALNQQLCCVRHADIARMAECAKKIAEMQRNFIVPYISVLSTDSELRILMPRYSMSLEQWAHRKQKLLTEVVLLKIAYQLTLGLIDLHDEGIFHLDFHGGNVFVANSESTEPHCVIADLEASYYHGITPSVPREFTEAFAAPERRYIRAPPSNVTSGVGTALEASLGKCDVWSLGLVLYSMAAGSDSPGLAEATQDLGTIMMNHEKLTPTRIATIVRRDLTVGFDGKRVMTPFSEGLISLLTTMLNHDPSTRPALYDVLHAVQALLDDATSPTKVPGRTLPFPLALAPFQLVALPDEQVRRVDWYPSSAMYDVHGNCAKCLTLRSTSRRDRSDCREGQSMHIPSHASHPWSVDGHGGPLLPGLAVPHSMATFLYPMFCDAPKSNETLAELQRSGRSFFSSGSAAAAPQHGDDVLTRLLQLQGGFAFSHDVGGSSPLAAVYTFVPHGTHIPQSYGSTQQLQFTAAQPWPSSCTTSLKQKGRIHVDVPSLLGTTAKCFSWIMPHEAFRLPNNETWTPAPFGGFVFWFNPDAQPHGQDRYFALCEPTTLSSAAHPALTRLLHGVKDSLQRGYDSVQGAMAIAHVRTPPIRGDEGGGEPMESPAHITNLTDRTPAGRVFFNGLDAVSPALAANHSVDVSVCSLPGVPNMPRPVSHSPEVVGRLTRTNIDGYRIHPTAASREASVAALTATADSSRHTSESRPSTFAQTAANSAAGSRAASQSQPSFHVHSAVYQQQPPHLGGITTFGGGGVGGRYPSVASVMDDAVRGVDSRSVSLEDGRPQQPAQGLPPRHSDNSTTDHFRRPGADVRWSSTDPISTRPASYLDSDGFMPPPTRTATPVDQCRRPAGGFDGGLSTDRSSVLTDPSPVIAVRGRDAVAPPPAAFPSQQLNFDTSPSLANGHSFGRFTSSVNSGGSVAALADVRHRVEDPLKQPPVREAPPFFPWTEWSYPVLEAALYIPGPDLTHSTNAATGATRFRIVSSGEFGSCGPVVPLPPSSLLFRRLQLPERNGIAFACFVAVDMHSQLQLPATSVGPGGSHAASAYRANERYLQHHGIMLMDGDFKPCGLVAFHVFVRDPRDAHQLLLPVMVRAVVADEVVQHMTPVGALGEYDPFLAAPLRTATHYQRGGVPSAHPMATSARSSTVSSNFGSSYRGRDMSGGLGGAPTKIALDLQRDLLYVGCDASASWLQLCFS